MLHPVPQKRRCEAAANWTSGLAKRVCVGPALCPQTIDVAMEISWTPPPTAPQPEHQQTRPTSMTQPTSQCCPRCLAGEPGHINHILGLTA
ncbi:uncharacterized protein si:ch211-221j21.3 [Gadus macrocephalus]|uniref:uncharacterized protein si:ch211-221j21.3 n=1 Tax=Gadus macrocephalus TaxID=80720 RepID=UPI0028CB37F3|nr:uncharacterized protein si:ch211-221j21.3 [Gadus macrocephalus]